MFSFMEGRQPCTGSLVVITCKQWKAVYLLIDKKVRCHSKSNKTLCKVVVQLQNSVSVMEGSVGAISDSY